MRYGHAPRFHSAPPGLPGTPVVAVPEWLSIRLGLIDADPEHRARAHFNVGEKAPWFDITDALPQHAGDTPD